MMDACRRGFEHRRCGLRRLSLVALAAVALTFGAVLLCSSSAQAGSDMPVKFGVSAGLNLAKMAYDPDIDESGVDRKMRMAMRFGGDVEYVLTPMFSVASGLIYNMKGEKAEYSGTIVSGDVTSKIDYLTIPILLKVGLGKEEGPAPFLQIGPELGILMSAKSKSDNAEVDFKDNCKSTEIGLVAGGGVEFPLNETFGGIAQVGYELGLTDIGEDEESTKADDDDDATSKTTNIYLSVGVRF